MQLNTYRHLDGQGDAAVKFYQRCLGGESAPVDQPSLGRCTRKRPNWWRWGV